MGHVAQIAGLPVFPVAEDEDTRTYIDQWGATVRRFKKHGGPPEHIAFGLDSPESWRKRYREPLLHFDKSRFPDLEDLKRRFKKLPAEVRPADGVVLLTADPDRMRDVHGIGEKKLVDPGPLFLEAIRAYCEEHDLGTNAGEGLFPSGA